MNVISLYDGIEDFSLRSIIESATREDVFVFSYRQKKFHSDCVRILYWIANRPQLGNRKESLWAYIYIIDGKIHYACWRDSYSQK